MKYKAKELNGHHIGASIEVDIVVKDEQFWNKELKKWDGEVFYEKQYVPISMITHKKNGDVVVRAGYDYKYEGSKEVDIKL